MSPKHVSSRLALLLAIAFIPALSPFPAGAQDKEPPRPPRESRDADGFLWGTEATANVWRAAEPDENVKQSIAAVRDLKMTFVKLRLQRIFFSRKQGEFSPKGAMPSVRNPRHRFDMDETVKIFEANGWSMVPMLSHYPPEVNDDEIDDFVDFVEWFIDRYKKPGRIRYLELINCPVLDWKGTPAQLLEVNNKVYDRVKKKHPDILIGTHGFEYWLDREDRATKQIEHFLDKKNGAKFDFWAFHGYALCDSIPPKFFHPPTASATKNRYAGIPGIVEIRKKLDANGWHDRPIIDTEHVGIHPPGPKIHDEIDAVDAAYTVQELLLKRTLSHDGKRALAGIIPLKMCPRGRIGEFSLGSLKPDGSPTQTVKAVGVLLSLLNDYKYASHLSGAFDNDKDVWVEKFQSADKELYAFFKPFEHREGQRLKLDKEGVNYVLKLEKPPKSLTLLDGQGKATELKPEQEITLRATNEPRYLKVGY